MNNHPTVVDYWKAFDTLLPYYEQLRMIHQAYLNDEFEPIREIDYSDPYQVVTYYLDSVAYTTYNIKALGLELSRHIHQLQFFHYSIRTYIDIENKHGMELPYVFDDTWELKEVYMYLIHIFEGNDHVIIENSILNGDILHIFECFLTRL